MWPQMLVGLPPLIFRYGSYNLKSDFVFAKLMCMYYNRDLTWEECIYQFLHSMTPHCHQDFHVASTAQHGRLFDQLPSPPCLPLSCPLLPELQVHGFAAVPLRLCILFSHRAFVHVVPAFCLEGCSTVLSIAVVVQWLSRSPCLWLHGL